MGRIRFLALQKFELDLHRRSHLRHRELLRSSAWGLPRGNEMTRDAKPGSRKLNQNHWNALDITKRASARLNCVAIVCAGKAIRLGRQHRGRRQTASVRCQAKSLSQLGGRLGVDARRIQRGCRGVGAVTGTIGGILGVDDRPRFREYVVREQRPSYRHHEEVRVGTVLPDSGVTYYDVPDEYHVSGYRYTIVNGRPVLVEPRSRRVVDVID